jgi:hypothetical protein
LSETPLGQIPLTSINISTDICLTFNNGQKINGKLISISEEHELNPKTGLHFREVIFKVDKFSINTIPKEMIVGKINESIFIFDQQSVDVIIDDKGKILFPKYDKWLSSEAKIGMLLGGLGCFFIILTNVISIIGFEPIS